MLKNVSLRESILKFSRPNYSDQMEKICISETHFLELYKYYNSGIFDEKNKKKMLEKANLKVMR